MALVDSKEQVFGLLAGKEYTTELAGVADEKGWDKVVEAAEEAIKNSRKERLFTSDEWSSRKDQRNRGYFRSLECGVSIGQGSTQPTNIENTNAVKRILNSLSELSCFQMISKFSSGKSQ